MSVWLGAAAQPPLSCVSGLAVKIFSIQWFKGCGRTTSPFVLSYPRRYTVVTDCDREKKCVPLFTSEISVKYGQKFVRSQTYCGIMEQKKNSTGKASEIRIKSGVWLILMFLCWFPSVIKGTMVIEDDQIRRTWVNGTYLSNFSVGVKLF